MYGDSAGPMLVTLRQSLEPAGPVKLISKHKIENRVCPLISKLKSNIGGRNLYISVVYLHEVKA